MPLTPIIPGLEVESSAWGITKDSEVRDYYTGYFEAMGDHLKTGIKLLDYGCGSGRFANYLSEHILDFEYWGIEQDNAFGQYSLEYALSLFGHDPRVKFGVVGGQTYNDALTQADVVVLSSVFTHLAFWGYELVMAALEPVLQRKGIIVFSCFLDTRAYEAEESFYGPGIYDAAWYTQSQLDNWQKQSGHHLQLVTTRFADFVHHIYRAS